MDTSPEQQFQGLKEHYLEALERGFPAFVQSIEDSTPINATPYVTTWSDFMRQEFAPPKRALVDALQGAIQELLDSGLRAEILLIGGSFLMSDAVPKDLDCVLYYTCEPETKIDLLRRQADFRAVGLDMRLLPIEMDPVMVLKTALFFGVLYTRGREASPQLRGLVLVDCSK